MLRVKRAQRAVLRRREGTRRAFHAAVERMRRNEEAFRRAQDDFTIERTIYEHAALMCHCRALLRELRGDSGCPRP